MSSTSPTIHPLTRFWFVLERLPGPSAVAAYWRHQLGTDYDLISRLLLPEARRAEAYPKLDGFGPDYDVFDHGNDHFVGVNEDGDRIELKRSDLVVYRLDPKRFLTTLAAAFDVAVEGNPIDGLLATYRVGSLRPLMGFNFPVFLTMQLEQQKYKAVVESLAAHNSGPFVLLAPTNHRHRMASQLLLEQRGCLFLPLADVIRPCGIEWHLTHEARAAVQAFTVKHLPAQEQPAAFFPTPAGATWSMLRLRFVDGHSVQVSIAGAAHTFNYTQMGMADRRNGKPTRQWELLRHFATDHGVMTWQSKNASRDNQKRKDKLADDLKAFFRIDGEPFRLLPGGKGWQTEFHIEPDV